MGADASRTRQDSLLDGHRFQRTIIREAIAKKLGLEVAGTERCRILGLGGVTDNNLVRRRYDIILQSRDGNGPITHISALTVDEIAVPVPHAPQGSWLDDLLRDRRVLADDLEETQQDQRIDMLIGADQHRRVVFDDQSFQLSNGILANDSVFGWLLLGPINGPDSHGDHAASTALFVGVGAPLVDEQFHLDLKRQWELDVIGIGQKERDTIPLEEDPVFQQFLATTTFENGRYTVRWPWKSLPIGLPRGEGLVRGCLLAQLKRPRHQPQLLQQIAAVFDDHLKREYIEPVPEAEIAENGHPIHYLPHHAVEREDKSTTKVRVVLNASVKLAGRPSLNDLQETETEQLSRIYWL